MQERAIRKVNRDRPLLIIGSPMCTDWSPMMELNWPKMSPGERDRRMQAARKHFKFCMRIYQYQIDGGRYFLHEHPAQAKSWKEPYVKKIMDMQDVVISRLDQCRYGQWIDVKGMELLAKKPTKFMTNSPAIAEMLRKGA